MHEKGMEDDCNSLFEFAATRSTNSAQKEPRTDLSRPICNEFAYLQGSLIQVVGTFGAAQTIRFSELEAEGHQRPGTPHKAFRHHCFEPLAQRVD